MLLKRVLATWMVFIVLALGISTPGCEDKKVAQQAAVKRYTIFKAVEKSITTKLYYKGSLNPVRLIPLLSPLDGSISRVLFKYGQSVKKGQILVTIKASRLAESYRQAVTNFLQKKAGLETQTTTYEGDKELYKAGVMSRQDYLNAGNTYATAVLSLSQAKIQLNKVLKQANIPPAAIEALKLGQVKAVEKILNRTFSNIVVRSPADGVVLIPVESKSSRGGGGKSNALEPGVSVKALQSILALGDPTGYQVKIAVNEFDITEMKVGLLATITSESFPGIVLKGQVVSVSVQADPNQSSGGSGVSMFNVLVNAPNVPAAQRKDIRVGMTAKVEIRIKRPGKIMVPIDAVFSKNGKLMVTIVDAKTGKHRNVQVETGTTTLNEVAILKGLKTGDKVVVQKKADPNASTP